MISFLILILVAVYAQQEAERRFITPAFLASAKEEEKLVEFRNRENVSKFLEWAKVQIAAINAGIPMGSDPLHINLPGETIRQLWEELCLSGYGLSYFALNDFRLGSLEEKDAELVAYCAKEKAHYDRVNGCTTDVFESDEEL